MKHWRKVWLIGLVLSWWVMWPHLKVYGQDIYTRNMPEALPHIAYTAWAVRERAGLRPEYAGESDVACRKGIVVRIASEAEWQAGNYHSQIQAITATCPMPGAYQVAWKPGVPVTRSLTLHELSHAMGCWKHIELKGLDLFLGSRHVMAPTTPEWTALTVQDVDCILQGAFWPQYQEPDLCFVELTPEFDLIAPDALGHYTRLRFVGDVLTQDYRWKQDRRVAGPESECSSVSVTGGQIVLDDVRSMEWSGSAVIAPEGSEWRLVAAYPR
jgi:hypothetical protein